VSAKAPLVSYDQLHIQQKCIYQAFGCAEPVTGKAMALAVNAKGYSADDGMAVSILAAKYGFTKAMLCTGNFFNTQVAFTPGAEYIVVIASGTGPARVAALFRGYAGQGVDLGDAALTHRALGDVIWHAVYAKAGSAHRADLAWTDRQGLRSDGPREGDCVIFYERAPA